MLIEMIYSKKNVVVVSDLILLETIHVIRRKIAENTSDDHAVIQDKINTRINEFLNIIREMSKNEQVLITRPNLSVANHHARVLKKFVKYCGQLRIVTRNSTKKNNYKGLGHVDFEHAFFAQSHDVQEFYSGDTSFEDLKDDSDFKDICFNTIKPSGAVNYSNADK